MPVTVSPTHRVLLVQDTPGARAFFPDAKLLGDQLVVKHDLAAVKLLHHIGYDNVPNPMLMYYDWNGGSPFAVQKSTCRLLTENPRAYVLNEMGTGKTRCPLWAWDYLNKGGMAKKLLVVAPLSTLRFVWQRECFATLPQRRVEVLHGTKQQRLDRLAVDADIYIVNHDGLKTIESELQSRADIDTLVLDELAVYRNNSDRSKRMRKFANRFTFVWGLTGAPMPNEPTDVWAQCKIITPSTVPSRRTAARDMLMVRSPLNQYIWFPRTNAVETAFSWMQPAVRYSLDEVVELPELFTRWIDVDLTAQQKFVYEKVRKELCAAVRDRQITAMNAGVAMGKLLQIAGGWVYTSNPDFVVLDATPRVQTLVDLVQSSAHKVLIAVAYRHAIEGLSAIFKDKKIAIDHEVVHGDTGNREHIFGLFQQTDKVHALLCHPQCVSHGLTLTAADTIIWYGPITSLEIYDQFNARIRRVGQKHRQQLIHLQGAPVERKLYKMLYQKMDVQDKLLDMFEDQTEQDGTPWMPK